VLNRGLPAEVRQPGAAKAATRLHHAAADAGVLG